MPPGSDLCYYEQSVLSPRSAACRLIEAPLSRLMFADLEAGGAITLMIRPNSGEGRSCHEHRRYNQSRG